MNEFQEAKLKRYSYSYGTPYYLIGNKKNAITYNISYLGVEGIITLILISLAPVSQAIRLAGRIVASREDKEDKKKAKKQATVGLVILIAVLLIGFVIAKFKLFK